MGLSLFARFLPVGGKGRVWKSPKKFTVSANKALDKG